MTERFRYWITTTAVLAVLITAEPAAAVRIDGLSPLQGVAAQSAEVVVRESVLRIAPKDGAPLTITPWPTYLPQRFGPQQVSASRLLHPAGPSDRIELLQPSSVRPWLVIASGLRPAQQVIGDWTLDKTDAGRWILRHGDAWRALRPAGRAAELRVGAERWCVYLLEARDKARGDGSLMQESEAQVALAAVRKPASGCRTAGDTEAKRRRQ